MHRALAILVLLPACNWTHLHAQEAASEKQVRTLRIPRVSRAPVLDDFLKGVAREAELTVTDFRQYRPGDGTPSSQPTTAYLSYDDKNLYVGFVCRDDPKLVRARLAKHDQILQDDRVMVNVDTFHDHRQMYWFNVNQYGVQADGVHTDGRVNNTQWDTLWHSDARITEDGYVVLVTIPFKSIRFPSGKQQTWGLMLGRFITRGNEWVTWPHVSSRRADFAAQSGDLEGLADISPGRNIQLIPYGLFSRSRYLDGLQFRTENETRVGLDGKLVLKDALTLDLALNPDFSQVESDEPQVTINQRYEVFFPEKRPFFMDNASYFVTPEQVLFTRRIVDPAFGARLTGKIGDWTIGALFADDRVPGEKVAAGHPWSGRHTPVGVVRVQREFRRNSRNSSIAVMAASQDFASTHNRVYSVDARLQLLANWFFTGQAIASDTRLVDGRRLAGPAYYAQWSHSGRHFVSTTRYRDRSPSFRSQLGFFTRVDIREASHTIGYDWRPEGRAVQSFGPEVTGSINYDRQGRLQDWSLRPEFGVGMTRSTNLSVWHERLFELYNNAGFRQHASGVSFSSQWLKWFAVNATLSRGTGINYRPGPALAPFLGRRLQGRLGLTLRPGPRLRMDNSYTYSGLKTYTGSGLAGVGRDTVVFDNHIVRSNVNYQFSRRFSLRWITDYNAVLPNSTLMRSDKTKRVSFDGLFTYMLHPGTALHFGYTDLYDNLRLDPSVSPALQRTSFPDLNTGRQVFVKLSYLLRF